MRAHEAYPALAQRPKVRHHLAMDWGEGTYEHTASDLAPAADVAVDALGVAAGQRILDVGCGTGNAALAAARRGATVTALDPSPRLLAVTAERAPAEGMSIETVLGSAAELPFADGAFDGVVSVFALIFADDAVRAASEVARVVRPGGRFVMTSWHPSGPVHAAGGMLRDAALAKQPALGVRSAPSWGDPAFVERTLGAHGKVTITENTLAMRGASPEAWFEAIESYHPVWRSVRALIGDDQEWAALKEKSVRALKEGNEDPDAFCTTSRYYVIRLDRPSS